MDKAYYELARAKWIIPKGVEGLMWTEKENPGEIINYKVHTTQEWEISEYDYEFVSAGPTFLYIKKKHTDGKEYYLQVKRT